MPPISPNGPRQREVLRLPVCQLDDCFASPQHGQRAHQDIPEHEAQTAIRDVAAGKPEDVRRRTEAPRQIDEVTVLCEDNDIAR